MKYRNKYSTRYQDLSLLRSGRAALGALIVFLAVSCTDGDNLPELTGQPESTSYESEATDSQAINTRFGGYSEEEIGVDLLVDEYLLHRFGWTLTRYRTLEDARAAEEAAVINEDSDSHNATTGDRAYFEQAARFLFFAANEARPPEVESASDELFMAFYDSLDLCAARSQWPDIPLYLFEDGGHYPTSAEQYEAAQGRYGFSMDEFLDLRHECHKFAASYPSLDREYRDELLNTRRDYYLDVLRLWMRDNPEMIVPMTYEQSVNHPYQDYVREVCRAADDPQECALSEGVTLE